MANVTLAGTIYKYYPFNDYSLRLLSNGELYFANPTTEFNDPFDCRVEYAKLNNSERSKSIKSIVDILPNHFLNETLSEISNLTSRFRVCCFSKIKENLLMWSHYADKHQGFCVGLKTYTMKNEKKCKKTLFIKLKNIPPNFNPILKVNESDGCYLPILPVSYRKKTPAPYHILNKNDDDLVEFFLGKGKDWAYEKELRGLMFSKNFNSSNSKGIICNISTSEIKEIILGVNATKNMITAIQKIQINAKKFKCERVKGEYAVKAKEVQYF